MAVVGIGGRQARSTRSRSPARGSFLYSGRQRHQQAVSRIDFVTSLTVSYIKVSTSSSSGRHEALRAHGLERDVRRPELAPADFEA